MEQALGGDDTGNCVWHNGLEPDIQHLPLLLVKLPVTAVQVVVIRNNTNKHYRKRNIFHLHFCKNKF